MNCNSRSNNSSSKILFTIKIILKLFSDNSACNVANNMSYILKSLTTECKVLHIFNHFPIRQVTYPGFSFDV